MNAIDYIAITCPHCNSAIEITIDICNIGIELIEDCHICCSPILLRFDVDHQGNTILTKVKAE